jgi:excisionase family DNA binding protein
MSEEKLLTVREVAVVLGISEKEVMDLAEDGKIPAYKVGGVYLRFKREQVDAYRKTLKPLPRRVLLSRSHSFKEGLADFLYFNDFYILSAIAIFIILIIIFWG